MSALYELCRDCDHFVEPNDVSGPGIMEYIHLADCEDDNPASNPDGDHDGEPSGMTGSLWTWKRRRPDLFIDHGDGHIGPNSTAHVMLVRP